MYTLPSIIDSLVTAGSVIYTSLTPTDLMVITGRFKTGDKEASEIGLNIFSRKAEMTDDQFILKVMDQAVVNSGRAILEKMITDETGSAEFNLNTKRLIDASVGRNVLGTLDTNLNLNMPIIGLGGPAAAYLSSLKMRLNTNVIIPENHEIGNAMGTVRSKISETSYAMIFPSKDGGYEIRSSFGRTVNSMHFDDAVVRAKESASSDAVGRIEKQGGTEIHVHTETDEVDPKDVEDIENVVRISARATGDPMGYIVGFKYL